MYRAYALARHDVHLAESTASVLMDRVLGVLSMAIVGAVALPFAAGRGRSLGPVDRARPGLRRMRSGRAAWCSASAPPRLAQRLARLAAHHERPARHVVADRCRPPLCPSPSRVDSRAEHVRCSCRRHGSSRRGASGRSLGIELPLADLFRLHARHHARDADPDHDQRLRHDADCVRTPVRPGRCAGGADFALSMLFLALGILGQPARRRALCALSGRACAGRVASMTLRRDCSGDSGVGVGRGSTAPAGLTLRGVLRARCRRWAAARIHAVRPASACGLGRRGVDRLRADGFRTLGRHRCRCSVEVGFPGGVAGGWSVDLGPWTATPGAAHRATRMERPGHRRARLRAPPDARPGRAAIRPRWRAGRVRESGPPRVLHGRFRVAYRA